MGASGTGKSTLARSIAKELSLPLIQLDHEFWLPGVVKPDPADWLRKVAKLAAAEEWVMDGSYLDTIGPRLEQAQAVVWLDLPRRVYVPRILFRTIRNYGRDRDWEGSRLPENFNLERLWNAYNYPREKHPKMQSIIEAARLQNKIVRILKDTCQISSFTSKLPDSLYA